MTTNEPNPNSEVENVNKESFLYQMDILKLEMEEIAKIIARMDDMAQATKNWSISIWTGSLAIALSQPEFRRYIIITVIAPLLFWYIDSSFRRIQRRSIFRGRKISEFLNSSHLAESFDKNRLVDFVLYDVTGSQYRKLKEYKTFVSQKRTFLFPEVGVFYSVLALISIALGAFFLFVP